MVASCCFFCFGLFLFFSLFFFFIRLREDLSASMVKSLRPSDAIWRHRFGSTLAQVMACCLMAPSHYLNQCWLIVSEVQWQSPGSNFTRDTSAMNHKNYIENYLSKLSLKSPRGQWVNHLHGTETERLPMWLPYNKSQLLTYWDLYKMVDILQTTFLNAFCWWGITVFLVKFHKNIFQNPTSLYSKFHWCLFLGTQQICQHWFTKAMAWRWMDEVLQSGHGMQEDGWTDGRTQIRVLKWFYQSER